MKRCFRKTLVTRSPLLVLIAEPPTQPPAGVPIDRAVGFADGTQTKVVGPADQHSIELLYECLRSLPDGIPSGLGANGATDAVALGKERPLHPKNCVSQRYAMYVSIAGR